MGLSIGIVGLPNVGKSTLFNALASRRLAETAPHPFTTIEPHEAVVPVPDEYLEKLYQLVKPDPSTIRQAHGGEQGRPFDGAQTFGSEAQARRGDPEWNRTGRTTSLRTAEPETVPATVTFIDIAGLVKGAAQGEGLGNQFLAKIREVSAIVHVVRVFEDPNVPHVHAQIDPKEDIEVINLELELGEIKGKPAIYVVNLNENQLGRADELLKTVRAVTGEAPVIAVAAKMEEELSDLAPAERREYLQQWGIAQSGLEKLITEAYRTLDLITFYTIKGGKEVHAWSIKRGSTALEAAGEVHTDFAKNFIKAEAIHVEELLKAEGWRAAKELGKVRLEGRDYVVQDRDVIEFKVGAVT